MNANILCDATINHFNFVTANKIFVFRKVFGDHFTFMKLNNEEVTVGRTNTVMVTVPTLRSRPFRALFPAQMNTSVEQPTFC
jgi:hypothetical protein